MPPQIEVDLSTARPSFMAELASAFERVLEDDARAAELLARFCADAGGFIVTIDSVKWFDKPQTDDTAHEVGGYL